VRSLGGQELSAKVACVAVGVTTLPSLAKLELCIGREQALMVCGTSECFFAAGLKGLVVKPGGN